MENKRRHNISETNEKNIPSAKKPLLYDKKMKLITLKIFYEDC